MKDPSNTGFNMVEVERRQVANLYQYIVRCPMSWL